MLKIANSAFILFFLIIANMALASEAVNGIAMHGEPKYKAGFTSFEYVNPNAPKGGDLRLAYMGTFDSLNPYILKGNAVDGLGGFVYQTLTIKSSDEAFTEYGSLAESIEMPEDRSYVVFNMRKEAKWSDGKPLTAADVKFSFDTLTTKGHPFYKSYYSHVKEVKVENDYRVKFIFDMQGNLELPLIIGQMPVLPKHYFANKEFDKVTTEVPVGSGPYKVKSFEMGRRIVFERIKNWWGENLAVNKGRYNFDEISIEYYRDETVLQQALFSGNYDVRSENIAKAWATEYDVPAVKDGFIKKAEIKHKLTSGMQGFLFNIRRDIFKDIKTRQALNYAFDFEWSNKQFAYGAYKRTNSYFVNSELASSGVPAGRELEMLSKYKDKLPSDLFNKEFALPKTSGSGTDMRQSLTTAKNLLAEAGWVLGSDGILVKDGHQFKFEVLLYSPAFKRWFNPMIANLKKLGIEVTIRIVDIAQYQKRMETFDYDMAVGTFGQSLSPGNEQLDYWGSSKADINGSKNLIGIKDSVIDDLIKEVISAPSREELIYRTRALDRVLLWGYYLIPNWYIDYHRIAYWDKFGRPAKSPDYDLGLEDTWWYDSAKADKLINKMSK